MVMPEKLQPGPLAGRISFFAPVSLLFFFFLIFIITTLRGIDLHPMHYFFLATSFFAFHLLLAYLVDHISIHAAFAICSAVSIFLVVSYLRIVIGPRFAFVEAALTQFIYLVLFSYAFFFKGFTGLAITIGAIITLFVVMQLTARIDWRRPDGKRGGGVSVSSRRSCKMRYLQSYRGTASTSQAHKTVSEPAQIAAEEGKSLTMETEKASSIGVFASLGGYFPSRAGF